jgi:hypothetical protein
VVAIAAPLASGRLDAVWGSRRLSLRDIEASLRLRYRHHAGLRFASTVGKPSAERRVPRALTARYISDTLFRRPRRADRVPGLPAMNLSDPLLNQRLLSRLLRDRAEILETPVRFYAMSPAQVGGRRSFDGFRRGSPKSSGGAFRSRHMKKTLWQRWKKLAHRAAEIQAIVILTAVYWVSSRRSA